MTVIIHKYVISYNELMHELELQKKINVNWKKNINISKSNFSSIFNFFNLDVTIYKLISVNY